MSKKRYQIIPEKVPKMKKLGRKGSKYDAVIDDFLEADISSARITYEGAKVSMVAIGLRQRIKVRELKNLQVKYRSEKGVYLLKKK